MKSTAEDIISLRPKYGKEGNCSYLRTLKESCNKNKDTHMLNYSSESNCKEISWNENEREYTDTPPCNIENQFQTDNFDLKQMLKEVIQDKEKIKTYYDFPEIWLNDINIAPYNINEDTSYISDEDEYSSTSEECFLLEDD